MITTPHITVVTRTSADTDYLKAFLDHHLQICQAGLVFANVRPDDDVSAVQELCDSYDGLVTLVVWRTEVFTNDLSRMREELAKHSREGLILHLDKDEFISDLGLLRVFAADIIEGRYDFVSGPMIARYAPGMETYDVRSAFTLRELEDVAPIRCAQIERRPAFGDRIMRKCFLHKAPLVRIHFPIAGLRKAPRDLPVEHFGFSTDFAERMRVKVAQLDQRSRVLATRAVEGTLHKTDQMLSRMRRHFLPKSDGIPGFCNYQRLIARLINSMPEGGTYIELGVYRGKSITHAGEVAQVLNKRVDIIGYDLFDPIYCNVVKKDGFKPVNTEAWVAEVDCTIRSACKFNPPRVFACDSLSAAENHADGSVDVLWVDDDHSKQHLLNELIAWLPKMKRSGIMCGHDIDRVSVREGLDAAGVSYVPISKYSWIRSEDVSKLRAPPIPW